MVIETRREMLEARRASRRFGGLASVLAVAFVFCLAPDAGLADDDDRKSCTETANTLYRACEHEVQDDYWVAVAKCINVSDSGERRECTANARAERREAEKFCREQRSWRREACESLGESRYDPDFDPASFDDDFAHLTNPNPYFPLRIGNLWEYRGGDEVNTVEIVNETKQIADVRCVIARDLVWKSGDLVEATDDWYAQAKDGNTWYCGEEVKDFESFEGDEPRRPELVSIDGSFKAGRNRDKPGIIFQASPQAGQSYLEEFSLGNAEDVTTILSTAYGFGSDAALDQFVPRKLVELLCSRDCVVTKNFSLLEPGIVARKYYARGIGFFLEVNPDTAEVLQLVGCNFDPRCTALPSP